MRFVINSPSDLWGATLSCINYHNFSASIESDTLCIGLCHIYPTKLVFSRWSPVYSYFSVLLSKYQSVVQIHWKQVSDLFMFFRMFGSTLNNTLLLICCLSRLEESAFSNCLVTIKTIINIFILISVVKRAQPVKRQQVSKFISQSKLCWI